MLVDAWICVCIHHSSFIYITLALNLLFPFSFICSFWVHTFIDILETNFILRQTLSHSLSRCVCVCVSNRFPFLSYFKNSRAFYCVVIFMYFDLLLGLFYEGLLLSKLLTETQPFIKHALAHTQTRQKIGHKMWAGRTKRASFWPFYRAVSWAWIVHKIKWIFFESNCMVNTKLYFIFKWIYESLR